jgi:predicted outer membrane protein
MLKMLRHTPRGSFDNLYLTQAARVQQGNWAAYKGYATDGADQSLKQVAGNGVPIIEQQLQQSDALLPSASLDTESPPTSTRNAGCLARPSPR